IGACRLYDDIDASRRGTGDGIGRCRRRSAVMMVMTVMRALRLLAQSRERLLRAANVAALQRLTDLRERTPDRGVGVRGRSLAVALHLTERGVGLLGAGQIAGLDRGDQMPEFLTEIGLLVERRRGGRDARNGGRGHSASQRQVSRRPASPAITHKPVWLTD